MIILKQYIENHMKNTTSIPVKKNQNKTEQPARNRNSKVEIEGNFLNLKKDIYKKLIANIILSTERLCF